MRHYFSHVCDKKMSRKKLAPLFLHFNKNETELRIGFFEFAHIVLKLLNEYFDL